MNNKIVILRVDPAKRAIARMSMHAGKNAAPEVRRIIRAKRIGWRELLDIDGTVLVVAGGLDVEEQMAGWRLKGGEDTAGISMLFGRGPGGGMIDCPVDRAWLEQRIAWLDGEDVATTRERAEDVFHAMAEDVRAAVRAAMPIPPDGAMWIPAEHADLFGAVLALGAGTPSSKGQRLSPMGVMLHDILMGEQP